MAVLHRDGSNRTRDETCPDYSYFHVKAFLGIALICIAIFNDLVVASFGVVGIRSLKSDDLKMSGIHTQCLSVKSQRSTGERRYGQTPAVRIAAWVVIADLFSNLSIRQPCRHRPVGPTGYDAR